MNYTDKNGNEIKAGMKILMDDGSVEEVFDTMDQYGKPDLGINASNEDFMQRHNIPEEEREYYSLSNFSAARIEIIPEKEKMITVLLVEPMKFPEVVKIHNDLEGLQAVVGGLIQPIYPFDDPVALVGNDESKLLGMAPNRLLKDANGTPYDILCGPFFICGLGREDFTSLKPEYIEKYTKMFAKEMLIPVKKKNPNKQKER